MVYNETGRLDIYDISSGKFVLKNTVGDATSLEELKKVDFEGRVSGTEYDGLCTDGRYLYVLANDYRMDDREEGRKTVGSFVLVYDWLGNPVPEVPFGKGGGSDFSFRWEGVRFRYDVRSG